MSEISKDKTEKMRARKRSKQKKRAARNRLILAVVVILVIGVVGYFAGNTLLSNMGPASEETTLILGSDGSILFEEISIPESDIKASELKSFAKNQIKEYEAPEGESVVFKSAGIRGDKAFICTEYSSAKAYSDFTGYESFYGTVKEANAAGYDVETNVSAKSGELTGDEKIFILKEIVKVKLPEDVLYTTENWVEQTEDGVNILPINGNMDAPPVAYIVMGTNTKESEGE